jgi:Beta-lactamase class C and other penicillin binding proteins
MQAVVAVASFEASNSKTINMKTSIQLAALTFCTIAIATSCKKNGITDIKDGGKQFDAATFKQNIVTALGNRSIGYNFVISQGGRLADTCERGFARMSQDGAIKHSVNKEMNIASITKWLTAVGAMSLMKERNISLDDSIYKWLPQTWPLGAGVRSVTFKQLLTHRSGFTTSTIRYGTDYNSLRTCIGNPLANPAKGYNYSNVNFALFRIMFGFFNNRPAMQGMEINYLAKGDTAGYASNLADIYIGLMQQHVFTPAGVSNAICTPTDSRSTQTLMYNETAPNTAGAATGDWRLVCGGGGYYLSTMEIARVAAFVFHTEDILSKDQQQEMLANLYGLDSEDGPSTNRGKSYGKDGALFTDVNADSNVNDPDQGLQTLIMKFPGDVEVVFFINALRGGFSGYAGLIKNAYENAWINK